MRFRHWFIGVGSVVVAAGMFAFNADQAVGVALLVSALALVVWLLAAAHFGRKGLFDYVDMETLAKSAQSDPRSSAEVFKAIVHLMIAIVFAGAYLLVNAAPHPRSVQYADQIELEIKNHWPELPWPHYVPALIEHESCLSASHPRCWSPTSRLKSSREEGAGLGQLTRAYREDGSVRFDSLAEMRDRYTVLRGLSWDTIYSRPDLQIRTIVLMSVENWRAFRGVEDYWERLAFADAAYNGGRGGVQRERNACAMTTGCNADAWFGNVEGVCLKSRKVLYGTRNACDINRHHVQDVLKNRLPRYKTYFVSR